MSNQTVRGLEIVAQMFYTDLQRAPQSQQLTHLRSARL
jgi:hypothetical protein